MKLAKNPRWLLAPAAAVLLLASIVLSFVDASNEPASSTSAPPDTDYAVVGDGSLPAKKPALGSPRDPLSPDEIGYALALATDPAHLPAKTTDVHGSPGVEVLGVELHADVDATDRVAVVTLYDYTSNRGIQQTVNLSKGTVATDADRRAQPPLSPSEADVAVQIAIDHRPLLDFAREYEQAQGIPLLSPDQVTPVVGTFLYDGSTSGGEQCGRNRCAQLMLRTPSGAYLSTWQFVVDLTAKRVVLVNEEAS